MFGSWLRRARALGTHFRFLCLMPVLACRASDAVDCSTLTFPEQKVVEERE